MQINTFNTASTYVSKGIVTSALDDLSVGYKESPALTKRDLMADTNKKTVRLASRTHVFMTSTF
jgi:hypothetical protein